MTEVLFKCALCNKLFSEKEIRQVETGAYVCKPEYEHLVKEGYIPTDNKPYKLGIG